MLGSIMLIVVELLLVDVRLLAWNKRGFELVGNGVELNLLVFRRFANCRIQKKTLAIQMCFRRHNEVMRSIDLICN